MNKLYFLPILSLLIFPTLIFGQNFNRPITPELFPYEFELLDNSLDVYSAVNIYTVSEERNMNHPNYRQPMAIIMDPHGYIVWYGAYKDSRVMLDFKYDTLFNEYYSMSRLPGAETVPLFLDQNFEIIDSISDPGEGDYSIDVHDIQRKTNGNWLILGVQDSVIDLSGYTFNGVPGTSTTTCICNLLNELDADFNEVWSWNSCDHIFPTEAYDDYGFDASSFDYAHVNSIYVDTDGHYIMSFRHLNSVVKVDSNSGSIIWQLGGKSSSFTFVNDVGFSGQHHAVRRPNGNLSLFDNGNMAATPRNSRGLEYVLDTVNWTATLVDDYTRTPRVYSPATGSYYQAGNTRAISYGFVNYPEPNVVMFDENQNEQAVLTYEDSVRTYRTQIFKPNYVYDRPVVSCLDSNGTTYLKAEDGHASYLWSTGETTQSIEATLDTAYQVWVPQGIGKMASEPVHYDANYCSTLDLQELNQIKPTVIKTFDVTGRAVNRRVRGAIYIDVYSDGSTRKYFFDKESE